MTETGDQPVGELSFEAALAELEQVVARLEKGDVPLEESITLYARGAELRRHCEEKLKAAEARVAEITQGPGGEIGARPVEIS
jgi:exodeoxyribonuclease VII small subunit